MTDVRKTDAGVSLLATLNFVSKAALTLSTAMVEAETKGADFELVDAEWCELTAALETLRSAPVPQWDAEPMDEQAIQKRAVQFAISWGASGTHGGMIAEFAIRELKTARAAPARCDAGSAPVQDWERVAWDWQKRAFDAEAKLAALSHLPVKDEAGQEEVQASDAPERNNKRPGKSYL